MLILSAPDIARAITDARAIDTAGATLRALSAGTAIVPPRIKATLDDRGHRLLVMPAYVPQMGALATKMLTVIGTEGRRGVPAIRGAVVLSDPETGRVLALLEGAAVTALRTAAASAAATLALAAPNPRVLTVFGAGVEARAHLRLLAGLYPLTELRICSRDPENAKRRAADASALAPHVRVVSDPEEATTGADLVVTATSSARPVVRGAWLSDGTHVCAIGSATPTHRELDTEVLERAAVIAVDTREGALAEAGDLIIPMSEGRLGPERITELGAILLSRSAGRTSTREITVYKGVGTAALDAGLASEVYAAALERGIGVEVSLADEDVLG